MRGVLRPSPAWRVTREGGLVVLSAGADRLYVLDDLDEATARELVVAWEEGSFVVDGLSGRARDAVAELVETGVLEREAEVGAPRRALDVRWVGERDERLASHLVAGVGDSRTLREADDEGELVLVVRTTGRLVETYEGGCPIPVPHLLLDVAYHHTVSLGPLVFVGETSCLACLAGRIGQLWGDPEPPSRPATLESPALAAALAVRELERAAAGDVRLANATAAYDLDAHEVTVGAVFRLPWCPVCGDGAESGGRIELPWSKA